MFGNLRDMKNIGSYICTLYFQNDECDVMTSFKSEEFVPLMTNIHQTLTSTLNMLSEEKQTMINKQVCILCFVNLSEECTNYFCMSYKTVSRINDSGQLLTQFKTIQPRDDLFII